MKNQKSDIVIGVIGVIIVVVMFFGIVYMHGSHGDHKEHAMSNQQGYSETAHHHMHQSDAENAQQLAADEKK